MRAGWRHSSLCSVVRLAALSVCVNRFTCRTPHFLMHSRCTALRTDITHTRGSSHQGLCLTKHSHFISARRVPCFDALYTKHLHSVLSCSGSRSFIHCEDPQPLQGGASAEELPPPTGYEPNGIVDNQIVDNQENMHFTEEDQITELEDRVKSLSYNQSFLPSNQDLAESIATPPQLDFDDEQLPALLASPLYPLERGASAERSQVYHSERESLMSSSSQDPTTGGAGKPVGTGKPVAVFSSQSRLNQDTFADRDQFSLKHEQVFGSNEPIFRFSLTRQMLRNLFLMETEISCLLKRDLNI